MSDPNVYEVAHLKDADDVLMRCPLHREHVMDGCYLCATAIDLYNMQMHPLGLCNMKCRSLDHFKAPPGLAKRQGTLGKSGILVYYPDGTTSADRPESAYEEGA